MKRILGRFFLWVTGWKAVDHIPDVKKYVVIAYPHTSNWDFPFMMAIEWALGIRIRWIGKHTLFKPPFGYFFRAFGGIPVERSKSNNLVQSLVNLFNEREALILAVPAEGTRKKVEYWKSGFYRIAQGANVPIVLGFLDFQKKEGGFGPVIYPSGNIGKDMDKIRAFYVDIVGKYPERSSLPRLREENT